VNPAVIATITKDATELIKAGTSPRKRLHSRVTIGNFPQIGKAALTGQTSASNSSTSEDREEAAAPQPFIYQAVKYITEGVDYPEMPLLP